MIVQTEFSIDTCCVCGIIFGAPAWYMQKRRNDGGDYYCPNGHPLVFTEPRVKVLERELANLRANLNESQFALHREETKRKKVQAEQKRERRRISHGVCLCCHRHFTNLERHMATKHPEQLAKKEPA